MLRRSYFKGEDFGWPVLSYVESNALEISWGQYYDHPDLLEEESEPQQGNLPLEGIAQSPDLPNTSPMGCPLPLRARHFQVRKMAPPIWLMEWRWPRHLSWCHGFSTYMMGITPTQILWRTVHEWNAKPLEGSYRSCNIFCFMFLSDCLGTRQNGSEICRLLGKIDLLYNFETKYQRSKPIAYSH